MNEAAKQEPWAPDGCPPDVVELINIDSQLSALGLRGLASADSKQVRTSYRKLTGLLLANYERGRRDGGLFGVGIGIVLAGLVSALAFVFR